MLDATTFLYLSSVVRRILAEDACGLGAFVAILSRNGHCGDVLVATG